jgi:protein arginine kinase activator
MLCEKCKTREANVQLTQMVNGEVTTHHYCMKCAGMMNIVNSPMLDDFPLAKMLAGLLAIQENDETDTAEYMDIECPTCHTKYSDIASDSKFGCPDCYDVFDPLISDTIKQLQGSDHHKDSTAADRAQEDIREDVKADITRDIMPSAMDARKTEKLMELRRLLKVALANEEYEEAAAYRDQIRDLESGKTDEGAAATAAKKPAAKKPVAKKPAVKKPAVKKTAAPKGDADEPAGAKKPAGEKKTAAAKKPAAKKPAVKKPAAAGRKKTSKEAKSENA